MAEQLKTDPIGESDLTEYLNNQSDFAFELRVLETLLAHGFTCEHGGSYDDPVKEITREFDLRALKTAGPFRIRLAVECKNLKKNFPLLISCLPRRTEEAYHEIIYSFNPLGGPPSLQKQADASRRSGMNSIYKPEELVGKSTVQVGRVQAGQKKDKFYDSDKEVYSKWAQALSSAQDLIDRAFYDGERDKKEYFSAIFPILVIPDETLWLAEFNANGTRIGKPHQAERCPYFVGKSYSCGSKLNGFPYQVSHLEFVTFSGLAKLIDSLFSSDTIELIFP